MATTSKNTAVSDLVEQVFGEAFFEGRPARSPEYRAGVRAWLNLSAHGVPYTCPYAPASASFDAFYAGVDEGRAIWRAHEATLGGQAPVTGVQ